MDRRVRRSRTLMQDALKSLVLRKDYDAITVRDICDEADVGRSTFYAHYGGKDELKLSGLAALRRQLRRAGTGTRVGAHGTAHLAFSLVMFRHARDHVDQYRALRGGRGGAMVMSALREMIADAVRQELGASTTNNRQGDLVVAYVVGAYMAVLTWWLESGANLPPEQLDALFSRLTAVGLDGVRTGSGDAAASG